MPTQISTTVTPQEYIAIRDKARKRDMNLTQFLRLKLGLEVKAVKKPEPISLDKPVSVQ